MKVVEKYLLFQILSARSLVVETKFLFLSEQKPY